VQQLPQPRPPPSYADVAAGRSGSPIAPGASLLMPQAPPAAATARAAPRRPAVPAAGLPPVPALPVPAGGGGAAEEQSAARQNRDLHGMLTDDSDKPPHAKRWAVPEAGTSRGRIVLCLDSAVVYCRACGRLLLRLHLLLCVLDGLTGTPPCNPPSTQQ
jgi:hypothetical protein